MKEVNIHNVKLDIKYFKHVVSGQKNYEIRLNDRDYKQGDIIVLHEWGYTDTATGKTIQKRVGFITDYEQKKGYIVLALLDLN